MGSPTVCAFVALRLAGTYARFRNFSSVFLVPGLDERDARIADGPSRTWTERRT